MADEPKIERPADTDPHPEYPGLTWGDVRKAQEKAQRKVEAERKAEMLARVEETHAQNLRDEQGMTRRVEHEVQNLTPVNREMVKITLALPPQMPDIRIDGVVYKDRGTFTVTRAKAAEMLKIQYDGWYHEAQRKGDDHYAFYSQMNQATRAPVVINTAGSILSGTAPRGTHG